MLSDRVKISIIVPIYNVEKYLFKCINSIIMQTYTNLQIILIDDGSTDTSGNICDQYAQKDCRIEVYHTTNRGLVAARKYGLKKAIGEYIGFVDGDDYIDPVMFMKLLQNIIESDSDFVHSAYIEEDNRVRNIICNYIEMVIDTSDISHKEDFLCNSVLDEMKIFPSIWSKLFKADFIKKCYHFIPDSQQYGEDMICLVRCILESQSIALSKNAMYYYQVRERSLSHLVYDELVIKEIGLWNQLIKVFNEYGCFERISGNISSFMQKRMSSLLMSSDYKNNCTMHYFFKNMNTIIGKKIVLYGAGCVGQDYYAQICKYKDCEIVAWVDSKWEKYHFEYRNVISMEEILGLLFDVIVIAVYNKQIAQEIRDVLTCKGIPNYKIIWTKPEEHY